MITVYKQIEVMIIEEVGLSEVGTGVLLIVLGRNLRKDNGIGRTISKHSGNMEDLMLERNSLIKHLIIFVAS